MNKQPCILQARSITFHHAGRTEPILSELDFCLQPGKTGLIGPNGSGKTSFLHVLMGMNKPASGELLLNGKAVATARDWQQLRKAIGFVFQNPDDQLFMPTVLEDVAFGPLNLGLSQQAARDVALYTLEQLGIGDYEQRITHRLSGGEKRLVSLATVLAMKPQALLLDEPTNDLDPNTRERLIHLLVHLSMPMLIVSHDWDFLDRVGASLVALEHGKVVPRKAPVLHNHRHAHIGGEQDHLHGDSGAK